MAEVWYSGAQHVLGANSGYARGRNRMEVVKCHYTVGVNSFGVGSRGYFQFLVGRNGELWQFAPVDALCWDSGEWNDAGPGIEIEYHPNYHDEIFTQAARDTTKALVRWLHEEHGFPLDHWGGDRISEYAGFRGFIDHADLIQSEQHYDYWPEEDWAYIAEGNGMDLGQIDSWMNEQTKRIAGTGIDGVTPITNRMVLDAVGRLDAKVSALSAPKVDVKALAAEIAQQLPADSDADPYKIAVAVRDQFRKDPIK